MITVANRLAIVHDFDIDVTRAVAEAAAAEHLTIKQFRQQYTLPRPRIYRAAGLLPVKVLDFIPAGDYDTAHATVLHLPMANGLTLNKQLRAAMLHLADPGQRLIVFGNPGMPWREGYGKAPLRSLMRVAKGDLTPLVRSSLHYLQATGVTSTTQLGYSYGADRALAMAMAAPEYDIVVRQIVTVEPASLESRSLFKLARDFQSCGPRFRERLQAATSPLLRESRRTSDEHTLMVWSALLRPSNLAAARALSRGGFTARLMAAAQAQPDARLHLAWGSQSELVDDALMTSFVKDLQRSHPYRVSFTRLDGGDHSMADDVALHAAIMLHGVHACRTTAG